MAIHETTRTIVTAEKAHSTPVTMKIRFHAETGTYRAYIRLENKRYRTHHHANIASLMEEVNAVISTL